MPLLLLFASRSILCASLHLRLVLGTVPEQALARWLTRAENFAGRVERQVCAGRGQDGSLALAAPVRD
ncbi:MAG: hypothetical protein JO161_07385 [Planctomycetaceae bacterium]|nr:hypothetical protein [Planctomycetaceae bacterium]